MLSDWFLRINDREIHLGIGIQQHAKVKLSSEEAVSNV